MKKLRKMMALVIVAVMTMMYAVPMSFAADPDNPVSVTGLTQGDVAHFYKVVEWQDADATHAGGWVFTEAFKTLTPADMLAITGDPTAKPVVEPALTAELAGKIARLATGNGTEKTVGSDGKAELAITGDGGAGSGLFLVLITPSDVDTVYNPVFVGADYVSSNTSNTWAVVKGEETYSDESATKKSTLTLTKTATTTEDDWDDKKSNTTAVGDTVSFKVATTIPGYGTVYENPHFVMTDSLDSLKLVQNTVTLTKPTGLVKYNAETNITGSVQENTWDYKVETSDAGYTITFNPRYLKTVSTPKEVEVTYDAIVTSDAGYAINEEDNEVYIEYSHNPNDENDYNVKKDTTQHYTFSIDAAGIAEGESTTIAGKKTSEVVKVGVDAEGNPITETTITSQIGDPQVDEWSSPLAGAVFGLFTDSGATVPYKAKNADGTAGTTEMTATTGNDGRMNFAGLDAGTYYLKEISAPEGFVKSTKIVPVVITADVEEVTVTEWWNGSTFVSEQPASGTAKEVTYKTEILKSYTVTVDGKETAKYTFTNESAVNSTEIQWDNAELVEHPYAFENVQGTELPSTGGIGTTIFYVVGALLVLGAGVLLVTRRRARANEQ